MGIQLKLPDELLKSVTNPFPPENPIIIASGSLVGTGYPEASRIIVTRKYPETGTIGNAGGAMRFGFMLKLVGLTIILTYK
jgi:aldehyde:ferredoxin oxidoreductase